MSPRVGLSVARLGDAADVGAAWSEYARVNDAAFGHAPDVAQAAAKRPLVEPDRWFLASIDGEACGGAGSFPSELTLPGPATIAVRAVSDVGVLASHRRAGVATALMRDQLEDIAQHGEHLAVLHASESTIYRRFGYGPATRWRQVRIDTRRTRFRDDRPDPGGSFSLGTPVAERESIVAVHDAVRSARTGGLARSATWWDVLFGETEMYLGGGRRQLALVHRDRGGRPDGYAIYVVHEDWSAGQANHHLEVWELVGEDMAVEVALWQTLARHDLVAAVTGPIAVDHALWDVVVDPRQVATQWDQDLLWARVLDVPAVLGARGWSAAGRVVLGVDDPFLGRCTGTFVVEADDAGAGTCRTWDGPADLHLDVADLGAALLGGTSLRRLVRAGRVVEASAGAAARFDAMAMVDPAPWCWVRF